MNDDDDSKKLPRARWTSEDARAKETKRVSQLLDAESGQRNDAPPADPEPAVPVVMALETVPAPTPEIRATQSTLRVDAKTVVTPAKPVEAAPPRMGFLQRLFLRILNFFRAILGL